MTSLNVMQPIKNPVKEALKPDYIHHTVFPMRQFVTNQDTNEVEELYLPMVLLTGDEEANVEMNAYNDTLTSFKGRAPKKDESSNWDEMLDANRAYWIIYFSTRMPNDLKKKWFDSKKEAQTIYSWDAADVLMKNYIGLRMTQPCYNKIDFNSPTVFQDILDQVKKMVKEDKLDFFTNGLTSFDATQLMKFLVRHIENLAKSNGSSGMQ